MQRRPAACSIRRLCAKSGGTGRYRERSGEREYCARKVRMWTPLDVRKCSLGISAGKPVFRTSSTVSVFKNTRYCYPGENTSPRRKIESSRTPRAWSMDGASLAEGRGYSSRKDTYRTLCEEGKGIHFIQRARNSPRIRMRAPLPLGPPLQRGFARAGIDFEPFGDQNNWLK